MSVKCCKTAVDFLQQIYFMRTTLQSVNMNRSHLVSTLTLTRNILKGIKNQGKINNCFCLLIYVFSNLAFNLLDTYSEKLKMLNIKVEVIKEEVGSLKKDPNFAFL